MSEDEVLRMVARLREDVSGPLKRIELGLRSVGKRGATESKSLREGFRKVHDEFRKVSDVARTGVAPAFEAIGLSSLTAVGAVAALTAGLKSFADQGADVAAFGRRVKLTTDTIRGLEGVAEKFEVDPNAIRQGEQSFSDAMYLIRRKRGELYAHLLAQRHDLATELAATPETTEGNEQALKSFLKVLEDIKRVHGEPTARMFSKEVFGTDAFVDLLRQGNAGLEEAIALTLKLRGSMDTEAGESWVRNWSDFKATIEGVRNAVGNDLLPSLTELAKEGEKFFAANKVEIAKNLTEAIRGVGAGLKDLMVNMPRIEHFFDRLARVWHYLNMTPGQLVTAAMGGPNSPFYKVAPAIAGGSGFEFYDTQSEQHDRQRPPGRGHFSNYLRTGGIPSSAADIIAGLRSRGLDAGHAAVLGGNIEQESGFDPTRPNVAEGGIGLIQWRLERREALQHLARLRHKSETDANTQLDFLMSELKDTPAGRAFLASQSPQDMNRSLHSFIGYGDNSEARRLANGQNLLPLASSAGGSQTVTGSATLKVDVNAPRGTSVKAAADGLFDTVEVNRGLAMEPTGAP
jgi:hypothetical protein